MSVSILYYKVTPEKISSAQVSELIALWSEELPESKQHQIGKLRQQNDQILSLAGLQLLKLGMTELLAQAFSLNQLQFPAQQKPFLNIQEQLKLDFNISHSGNVVCCVISDAVKVGIDIERQRPVTQATLNKFLNDYSDGMKISDEEDLAEFFNIWTRNEAIIKAADHGSIYNMKEVTLDTDGGFYQNNYWYTYPIELFKNGPDLTHSHTEGRNKEYTCTIACSEKIADDAINIKHIIHL
jgi:4'-phosphopantetheinyl transferase